MLLTLLIPELVWSNPDEPGAFSPLAANRAAGLLARHAPAHGPHHASEALLVAEAGWPGELPPPLAALRLAGECERGQTGNDGPAAGEGFWLCADPVHLRFHQDRLILGDASRLDLTDDEAAALVADLNRALAPVVLHAPHRERWYLRLPGGSAEDTGSPAPSEVTGRALNPAQLGNSRRCRQLANEIQILLHDHPVNAARQARGAVPINALWLWGGGQLPEPRPALRPIVGASVLARGLARIAGAGAQAADSFHTLQGDAAATLVFLDDLLAPAHYQEAETFCTAWQALDARWLSPALGALRRGRLDELCIVAPTAYGTLRWQLRPRDLWLATLTPGWLRRGHAPDLATLAQQLASAPTR